jgi:putative FmdB family regulatory protein
MTYVYQCQKCDHVFDVIKSVKDIDVNETCPQCGEYAERQFVPSRVHFMGTKVEHAEYNPGLGCVVRNSSHRKELAKQMGLEEVGNQDMNAWAKRAEKEREERNEKRYEQAFEEARWMAQSPHSIPPLDGGESSG